MNARVVAGVGAGRRWPRQQRRRTGDVSDQDFPDLVEKRRFLRVRHGIEVQCHIADTESSLAEGRTTNMSLGGVRLVLRRQVPEGQRLKLSFLNESCGLHVVLNGAVVWARRRDPSAACEVGVQFDQLTASRQDEVLALLCQGSTEDPAAEKRAFLRVYSQVPVNVWGFGDQRHRRSSGVILNVGLGGMAVETDGEFDEDRECVFEALLPAPAGTVRAKARVLEAREQEGDFPWLLRLRFVAFEGEGHKAIGRFLSSEIHRTVGEDTHAW